MITQAQLNNHLATFRCPADNSPMAVAIRETDVGGRHDVILWKSTTGYSGLTHVALGQSGQGSFGTAGR